MIHSCHDVYQFIKNQMPAWLSAAGFPILSNFHGGQSPQSSLGNLHPCPRAKLGAVFIRFTNILHVSFQPNTGWWF